MEEEKKVHVGGAQTVLGIALSEDAKYYITVTDGIRTWRLKWNKKKLTDFRDAWFSRPEDFSVDGRLKDFEKVTWIFSEKAEEDYEKLMSIYNVY